MTGLDGWRNVAAGAIALGVAALSSPASAVDIKMWTLVNEGYPEFVAYRGRGVQEDPSGREHHLRELPERGLQDHHPGRAHRLGTARRVLQLGRRGCGAAGARRAWRSTSPSRQRRGRLQAVPLRGLAVVVRVRRQELRRPDRRRVEVLLLRQGVLRRAQARRRRRRSTGCSASARRSAPSIRASCPGRWATRSAGSSTTSSPC